MARTDALSRLQASGKFALELEAVSKHFGALVALADINLAVRAGERRAILGSNGAGKTTLFNAIMGDFPTTTGRVRFFGEDVTDVPAHHRIRRGLRRTYQISQLFGQLSVRDNVYLACRGVSAGRFSLRRPSASDPRLQQADTLIEAVHLSDVTHTLVSELSYGQQRQLEIALALAGAPRFILFDEPAAGLSPTERTELIEILGAALAGGTLSVDNAEREAHGALNVKGGATLLAIDPKTFGNSSFHKNITRICAEIKGNGDARVPGDGRLKRRESAIANGIQVDPELLNLLRNMASPA